MQRREFLLAGTAMPAALTQACAAAPVIKTSVMLWTLRGKFEEKLDVAAAAGCDSVELVGEHLAWSDAECDRMKKLAASMKLGMDTISSTPNWNREKVSMIDPAQREGFLKEFNRNLEFAKKLGIPQMLLMSGNAITGRTFDEQFACMLENCRLAGDIAAKAAIDLIIEPLNNKVDHKGFFMSNCVDGLEMVRKSGNPRVKLLFDVYHEQVQLGNVTRTIQAAAHFTNVFHVADNPGRHEPGTGEMDWPFIYKAIAKTGYSGYITMEYIPTGDQRASLTRCVKEMKAAIAA